MLPSIFCVVSSGDDLSLLPELAAAGVGGFQVRDKSLSTRQLFELARRVLTDVRPAGAQVVVNDRLDVALAAGADGVHLGAEDLSVEDARRLAPDLVIGATCRSATAVGRASADGATYAGFGPLFETGSKAGLPAPLGLAGLCAAVGKLPLVGVGGIDAARAREARAAGAHGVAVIGSIWRQPDPLAAAKDLVHALA